MADAIPTWTKCKLPPCICRFLAKSDDLLMTDQELMERTGWDRRKVKRVYRRVTWNNITVGDMDRFLYACRLKPENQRRYIWQLKRAWKSGLHNMRHLRPASDVRVRQRWRPSAIASLIKMVVKVLDNEQRAHQRS